MRYQFLLSLVIVTAMTPVVAGYQFSPDSPANLTGTTYTPWQVVQNNAGVYLLTLALPPGAQIDGLHLMDNGDWLFSTAAPVILGGTLYDPRDVVRYNGAVFSLFFGGAATGVPEGSDVDSVMLVGGDAGDLVIGFDVPTSIGGTMYEPADLVKFAGGVFSLYFDASAAATPVPITTNVTGAALGNALLVISFDVPTVLGAATFLPGDLVSWNGAVFALFWRDPGWPGSSYVNALAGIVCGAEVCDGFDNDCDGAVPANEADADGDGYMVCEGDCNDGDPTVFSAPFPIDDLTGIHIVGGVRFDWISQAPIAGSGTHYDAFKGTIILGAMNFSLGGCAANNLVSPFHEDFGPDPPPGSAFYFMFRGQNVCGTGTYGTPFRDAGAALSATACP